MTQAQFALTSSEKALIVDVGCTANPAVEHDIEARTVSVIRHDESLIHPSISAPSSLLASFVKVFNDDFFKAKRGDT